MSKALVLTLVALALGATVFAGPLTGSSETCVWFDGGGLNAFSAVLDVDYSMSSFDIGITSVFQTNTFDNLFITVEGTLGAIDVRTMVSFEPLVPEFWAWTGAAKMSLGGAVLFGYFAYMKPQPYVGDHGLGATLGFSGAVGDVRVTASTLFNMRDPLIMAGHDILELAFTRDVYRFPCYFESWVTPHVIPYDVLTDDCSLCWSSSSILVDFPLACIDVTAFLGMSLSGLGYLGFIFEGIETGISWLDVEDGFVMFGTTSKSVWLDWDVVLGDLVCVTPFFSIDQVDPSEFWTVDGITLNALLLEYSYNGVTVKAGEIFDDVWGVEDFMIHMDTPSHWSFTLDGDLASDVFWYIDGDCPYNAAYDEYIGIWIDGDTCCGGAYDIGLISFFDTSDTDNLFDWQELVATLDVGIGPRTSIRFMASLIVDGLQWFQICGEAAF